MRRLRFRFTLSTLVLMVTAIAVVLGARVESLRREHAALADMREVWPDTSYEWEPNGPPSLWKGSRVTCISFICEENLGDPTQFRRFLSFGHLKLLSFSFTSISPRHFECLPILPSVEELDLAFCAEVSDKDIACVAQRMPNLRRVYLPGTAITDEAVTHLAQLRHLQFLDIAQTSVTGRTLGALAACEVEELILDKTKITIEAAASLGTLSGLQILSMAYTALDAKSLNQLTALGSLRKLIIWGIDIDPAELRQLESMLPACRIVGADTADEAPGVHKEQGTKPQAEQPSPQRNEP